MLRLGESMEQLILLSVIVLILFTTFAALITRYRRCPSDKILVIYGKIGKSGGQ